MTRSVRPYVGAMLTIVAIAPAPLRADTVQLSLRDGRLTLVAVDATPAQIFDAWSRAGGVRVVNAERMPATPVTLTIQDVPEEQGLDTVLRAVTGYMARRRPMPAPNASIFDCIIILPALAGARPATTPAPLAAAAPGRPAAASPPPAVFPQGPGVGRLIGPDGQPMEDDQADGPPPFTGGDVPPPAAGRAPAPPRVMPSPAPANAPPRTAPQPPPATGTSQPGVSSSPGVPQGAATTAPAGVPRPGMAVPAPTTPQQPQR